MSDTKGKGQKDDAYTIRTSVYNERPELMGMECKNCGGVLELKDRTHAVCPYCGQKYLIDEAKGTSVNIHVDYSGSNEMRRAVNRARNALLIFLAVAAVLVVIILGFNIAAKKSVFSTSDSDIPVGGDGQLLAIFLEDIFGKEYKDITAEELGSIRYIKCFYEREGSETFNAIAYSFADYKDLGSEAEFQDTVKKWTYRMKRVSWPSDFSMLTGLTRFDNRDGVWMSLQSFAPDNQITCVDTDDRLDTVASLLDPEKIQVLRVGTMGNNLDGIGQFKNLEELEVDTNISSRTGDLSGLKECQNLRRLKLRCADDYSGVESIGELSKLESLFISQVELGDCGFLEKLTELRELSISTGGEPKLQLLENLPKLKRVDFLDGEYIPAGEIPSLNGVEELTIAVNDMEAVKAIGDLHGLRVLDLHMAVKEYGVPADVSCLGQLTALEEIYLDNFWSSDVCGLEEVLNLSGLKTFRYGKKMSTETSLLLDPELLTDNPGLEEAGFLNCFPKHRDTGEELDFGFLTHYPGVKRLYLDGCDLTDISFVSGMEDLRQCSFQDNHIEDLSPLTSCRKLELVSADLESAGRVRFPGDVTVNTDPFEAIYD